MDLNVGEFTINRRLQVLAHEKPEKPAFIFWDKDYKRTVLTRQDVWDKSRKFAAFLHRLGIRKGDVVCNTLVNSQERLITTYGIILAGAASLHGQKLLVDGEDIVKSCHDSQCKAILINPDEERGVSAVLEKLKSRDDKTGKIEYESLPYLSHVVPITLGDKKESVGWLKLLDQETELYVDETVTCDDVAMIMTTSGSTGFAKLVPHTHGRLPLIGNIFSTVLHCTPDTILFNDRSLGWIGGAPVVFTTIGVTRVLVDLGPGTVKDVGAFILHICEHEKIDVSLLMPTVIQAILDHLDATEKHKLDKLIRAVTTGGAPISGITMNAIGRITEKVVTAYGASEFGIAFYFEVNDENKLSYENACSGYPTESVELKIVDDNLQEVPSGKPGEILIRAPTLTSGYLNNPQVNEEVFLNDGWWRTSDIGHINERGQLFVYCRKAYAINHKGFLHYPGWMETRINKHPDIQKSVVVGIPDPVDFEQICLCIIKTQKSTLAAEEVHQYCKSLFLTDEDAEITPVPKYYLFFDSFPVNSNGKVDRRAIRQLAIQRVENNDL